MKRFPAYERLAFEIAVVALAMAFNLGDGLRQMAAHVRHETQVARPVSVEASGARLQMSMLTERAPR